MTGLLRLLVSVVSLVVIWTGVGAVFIMAGAADSVPEAFKLTGLLFLGVTVITAIGGKRLEWR